MLSQSPPATGALLPDEGAVAYAPPPPAPPEVRRVLIFVTVSLALLMITVDSTIVATALHALQHGLSTTINWASWTITAYSLGFVLMLPVSSKLSDRFGRRRVFLASAVVFTAASLLCGLADNVFELIALRALQAAGGAGFTPSATGIVVDHFGEQRDRAVGLFGSIFPVGIMIGPVFGGLFVAYWNWRGVFFVNVPIGLVLVALCLRYIPADPPWTRGSGQGTMDLQGMALLGIAILGGMLGAARLGDAGARVDSPTFVVPIVLAAVCAALFVRHIRRVSRPFIDPRLIYGRWFGAVNLSNLFWGGIPNAVIALTPLYAVNRYHLGALSSATLLVAEGIAAIVLSTLGSLALRRTGYRPPLYVGAVTIAIGIVLLALPPVGMSPYAWLALGTFVVGLGVGTVSPAGRNAGLQLAPEDSATIAALRTLFSQVGAIATISISTAILAKAHDVGSVQAWLYVAYALITVVALPLVTRIPEHHGAW